MPEGTRWQPAPVFRAEQELPAEDAKHEGERRHDDAHDDRKEPSLPQVKEDLGEVHILERPPQQRRGNDDTEESLPDRRALGDGWGRQRLLDLRQIHEVEQFLDEGP
jgi:hypothetical protein